MQIKTIEKVIINKMNEWLETITDEDLRKETKNNLLVSGGSIASMLMGADVSSSATRTIRMQQGLTQFEYTLPEDDAVMFMLILKRNKIWFADVTR